MQLTNLTITQMQKLAELQLKFCKVMDEILQIKQYMKELVTEKCSLNICIGIFNQEKYERESAKLEKKEPEFIGLGAIIQAHEFMQKQDSIRRESSYETSFRFDEVTGIHVLDLMLKEKRVVKNALITEMAAISKQCIPDLLKITEEEFAEL